MDDTDNLDSPAVYLGGQFDELAVEDNQQGFEIEEALRLEEALSKEGEGSPPPMSLSPFLPPVESPPSTAVSAAVLPPQRRKASVNKYIDKVQNRFIESLGAVEDLQQALAYSDSPRIRRFLGLISDPRTAKFSLSRLALRAGVSPTDLMDALRRHAAGESMLALVKSTPRIAGDIIEDAKSREIECLRCDGDGFVTKERDGKTVTRECIRCKGTGIERKPGDPDARKVIANAVGWTGKSNIPHVQVNIGGSPGMNTDVLDELERSRNLSRGKVVEISSIHEEGQSA